MDAAGTVPGVVRFGVFELDLATGELRKAGLRLRLQEQPFRVLAMLLERPGELVTRDELRARIWAEAVFVDFEHGLHKAVNKLRVALGESADSPRFVETLARRGYRFIAPVEGRRRAEPAGAGLRLLFESRTIPLVRGGEHPGPRRASRSSPSTPRASRGATRASSSRAGRP